MAKINHIGIIVDGNGRWAQERGMSRSEGHLAGAKNLDKLTDYIFKKGVMIKKVPQEILLTELEKIIHTDLNIS